MRRWLLAGLVAALPAPVAAAPPAPVTVTATLRTDVAGPKVDRRIFGQFVEHLGRGVQDGIWVGPGSKIPNDGGYRRDVLAALKPLAIPLIRWPGGCFAESYRWRDGIGPRSKRPVRINVKWGGVEEDNAFGTHEYFGLAERLGADAYLAVNMGSAAPAEMAQWIEYITSPTRSTLAQERRANGRKAPWRLPLLGIGNEVSNCGGSMRPDYAADVYRRYQTFAKGSQAMFRIATGPFGDEFDWTETMMRVAGKYMDGLSLHYYTSPGPDWKTKIAATGGGEDDWAETLSDAIAIDPLIARHSAIMDRYDPERRVALVVDEWGTWYAPEQGTNPDFLYQQNTVRDALVAALTFNAFVHHADRVRIAAIAQMVNVLQAMILTDGPRMVTTPTYHAFMLYRPFMDGVALPLTIDAPDYVRGRYRMKAVQGTAARGVDGRVYVALTNVDPAQPAAVRLAAAGLRAIGAEVLTGPAIDSVNRFDAPDRVRPRPLESVRATSGGVEATLPPRSVTMLTLAR